MQVLSPFAKRYVSFELGWFFRAELKNNFLLSVVSSMKRFCDINLNISIICLLLIRKLPLFVIQTSLKQCRLSLLVSTNKKTYLGLLNRDLYHSEFLVLHLRSFLLGDSNWFDNFFYFNRLVGTFISTRILRSLMVVWDFRYREALTCQLKPLLHKY